MMDASDHQDVPACLNFPPRQSSSTLNQGIAHNAADADKHTAELSQDKPHVSHCDNASLAKPTQAAAVAEPTTEAVQQDSRKVLTGAPDGCKKGVQGGLADLKAAVRQQRDVHSASPALSISDAKADQHRHKQADQKSPATGAKGQQQHQHMSASSALPSEPDQALPTEAVVPATTSVGKLRVGDRPEPAETLIPPTASIGKLELWDQPLPDTAGAAGGGHQGLGLSQEGQRWGQAYKETTAVKQGGSGGEARQKAHGYRYVYSFC